MHSELHFLIVFSAVERLITGCFYYRRNFPDNSDEMDVAEENDQEVQEPMAVQTMADNHTTDNPIAPEPTNANDQDVSDPSQNEQSKDAASEQSKETKPNNPFILPKHPFACESCGFRMYYNYKGTRPPFADHLSFAEPCYIAMDPFKPPPSRLNQHSYFEHFITLGCDCFTCGKTVCSSPQCNLFYRHFYCGECANASREQFPLDVQSRIRKNLNLNR